MDHLEDEQSPNLAQYAGMLWHRRWFVLGPAFIVWLAALMTGFAVSPKYRSETVILVEESRVPQQYVVPNVGSELQERLQSLTQQILSRTRLMGIIERMHLYSFSTDKSDPDLLVERMRKDIKIELVQDKSQPGQLSAFKIAYSASTPELAQRVTSELTSLFINENLRNREQMSESTTAFLESQLEAARGSLEEQEKRLREFKSQFLGELPEQLQGNVQILSGLQARLQAATDALNQARQQRLYLESLSTQYKSMPAAAVAGDPNAVTPATLEQRLEQMRAQLSDLSGRYTPMHPDIVRLRQQIAATERRKAQLEEEFKKPKEEPAEPPVVSANTPGALTAMQLEGQLKANELEIENRKKDIGRLEQQIDSYQSRLNMTPVREQQLAAITRDHQQSRDNYQSLLAKKLQSEMATNLEKQQKGEQFRMIDPPNLPQRPYFPDRLTLSLIGLAAGLAVGAGLAAVLEFATPRLYVEDELRAIANVPILMVLPTLQTGEQKSKVHRMRLLEGIAAGVMFLAIPLLTFIAYRSG